MAQELIISWSSLYLQESRSLYSTNEHYEYIAMPPAEEFRKHRFSYCRAWCPMRDRLKTVWCSARGNNNLASLTWDEIGFAYANKSRRCYMDADDVKKNE